MKLGILGTGMIVREFLPWLAGPDCPFTVQALCSTQRSAPVADEMCEQYGIPQRTTNYFELLQWVDVIYLAVPNLQHYRYAKVALEAGKHVIVEKPMACTAAQTEELAALARRKKVFLFEAMTTQYLENYNKIRELLPRIGRVKLVQCNFSQYSSRYDAFCAGETPVSFDPECAGGALMDLNVYNISYIVGLFGEPNQVHYLANMERGIDTSGILTMEYNSFKAVSMAAKDCGAPARYVIQGTKGYILQKSTANWCGGVTFHPNQGKEEHFNLNGGRPRQAAEFEAFARALESGDQELCQIVCHAADDADSGGRERISAVRNIHGKKACYRACKAENGSEGTAAENGKEEYPEKGYREDFPGRQEIKGNDNNEVGYA